MRRSIPSRVCDRCGEPYKLFEPKGPRKPDALRIVMKTEGPEGTPVEMQAGYKDLCPKCAKRTQAILIELVFNVKHDAITREELERFLTTSVGKTS